MSPPGVPLDPFVVVTPQAGLSGGAILRDENGSPIPVQVQPASNVVQTIDPGQAAAATITFPGASITRKKSGAVLVYATYSPIIAVAVSTLSLTLRKDGVALAGAPVPIFSAPGVGDAVVLTIAWMDTLADLAAHTYSAQAAIGGGATLQTNANTGGIVVIEL